MKPHRKTTFNCLIDKLMKYYPYNILAIKICGGSRDDCSEFATCSDTGPGAYTCTCNEGYTGNGKTCEGKNRFQRKLLGQFYPELEAELLSCLKVKLINKLAYQYIGPV